MAPQTIADHINNFKTVCIDAINLRELTENIMNSTKAFIFAFCLLTCGCKPADKKSAPSASDYNYAPTWMGNQRIWDTSTENKPGESSINQLHEDHKVAALSGDHKSQYTLALDYLLGRGTPKNEGASVKWLINSANQGNVSAQKVLAIMYSSGTGVEKDLTQSLVYWTLIRDNFPHSSLAEPPEQHIDGDFLNSNEAKKVVIINGKKKTKGQLHFENPPGLMLGGVAQREINIILEKISAKDAASASKKAEQLALQIKSQNENKARK